MIENPKVLKSDFFFLEVFNFGFRNQISNLFKLPPTEDDFFFELFISGIFFVQDFSRISISSLKFLLHLLWNERAFKHFHFLGVLFEECRVRFCPFSRLPYILMEA